MEESRILRMLESVEKEELNLQRPTGEFVRSLFSDDEEERLPDDEPDEDGQNEEDEVLTCRTEEVNPENDVELLSDFDILENIPLQVRQIAPILKLENGKEMFFSKSRKMLWHTEPVRQGRIGRRNIILMRMGHVHPTKRNAKTPLDSWELFFDNEMIQTITKNTNVWLEKNQGNYSRKRDCLLTCPEEIRAVFGLLYLAGVLRASKLNLEDLWSQDGLGVEFFRSCMSLKRFKLLLRAMRFDDLNSREERRSQDKLAPIRTVFDIFVEKCKNNYVVSEFVTIDEMLESFRGRCSFRQYIRNKPAKYGVKIYSMVCAKSFYTSNMEIYAGKQPEGPFKLNNSAQSVVERLVQPIAGSGRNVTVDNYFCSIPLCLKLQDDYRLTTVGTLKQNKTEIPPSFIDVKGREIGSYIFGFKKECTMVSFKTKPNKSVVLLSSMHDTETVDNNEESATYGKPDIILFYNASKGGVDTVDKYKESYSVARITNRWSMVIFYSMLNVGAINSFIIMKQNTNQPSMKRRKYLQDLGKELCRGYMITRLSMQSLPKTTKVRICQIMDIEEDKEQPGPAADSAKGRCYLCDRKKNRSSQTRCITCRFFFCKEHAAPGMCVNCASNNMDKNSDDE